jgi:hypothetical protein
MFLFLHHSLIFFLGLLSFVLTEKIPAAALALVISAPTKYTAIFCDCDGMVLTSRHHYHMNTVKILDSLWKADVFLVADTKLPMIVESPRVHLVLLVNIE